MVGGRRQLGSYFQEKMFSQSLEPPVARKRLVEKELEKEYTFFL